MKTAALLVIVGIVGASVAVGFFDWRLGLLTFSVCLGATGIWHLTQE